MAGCLDIQKKISFFMEREIEDNERKEVTAHLRECPICQAEAERYGKLDKSLNSLIEVQPPDNMASDLMSSIMKNEIGSKKPLLGVFQVLAVFMGIFSLPLIIMSLSKLFTASHQAYNVSADDHTFFIKLIMIIVKTLSSLLNDSPLFFDARIPLPAISLLPGLILAIGIFLTTAIILSAFLFSVSCPKNYLPAKR